MAGQIIPSLDNHPIGSRFTLPGQGDGVLATPYPVLR